MEARAPARDDFDRLLGKRQSLKSVLVLHF